MPGNIKHHTDKFRSCVEKVVKSGKSEDAAYAICTTSMQDAGEAIFVGAEMQTLHLLGAAGQVRTEMLDGKEYLVVPIVALMEGVIHAVNSEVPEFVPLATLEKAAATWNGRPVVLGHPVKDGKQCSANSPEILTSHGIGTIYNSRIEGTKLLQEAWVEKAKAKKLNPTMYERLLNSTPEEVSVGAFVITDSITGDYKGKKYNGSWLETVGDHLAFLPGGRGACSLEMGCGTHRAAMRMLGDRMELEVAAGARHSSSDMKAIQGVHDHSVSLGAKCDAHNMKFMSYTNKGLGSRSRRERTLALLSAFRAGQPYDTPDTPTQAASEEAAELIGYKTIRMLFDQVGQSWDEASSLIDDLIADEEENPTETAADEEAEEEVEDARLQAINALCMSMWSALGSVQSVANRLLIPDLPEATAPRYMEAFRAVVGKSVVAKNMKVAQNSHDAVHAMHDYTVALGVKCDDVRTLAMKDCPTCEGTGQVMKDKKQMDCPTCDGNGKIKAAEMRSACGCQSPHVTATIRNEGGRWAVYSKDGSRRLGMHNTEIEAQTHEKAIEAVIKRRSLELQGA